MPRGGARAGTPGKAYGNRSDLNAPKPLAPSAAPGQPYGAAGAQLAAQQAVPMGPPPSAPAQPAPGAPTPSPVLPGGLGLLHRPTDRPAEPVTAGVPSGPGPGPGPMQSSVQTLGGLLNSLAQSATATPEVRGLASFVNQGRV